MPLFSVSGLRGVVSTDLTPDVIIHYTLAYLLWLEGLGVKEIFVGRDTRVHGAAVQALVEGIALYQGFHVRRAGIVPTPVIVWGARQYGVGGVVITASHNPPEWNALKFIHPDGRFPTASETQAIGQYLREVDRSSSWASWEKVGQADSVPLQEIYMKAFLEKVRKEILGGENLRGIRVGVDPGGGATFHLLPRIFMALEADVIPLHAFPQGLFPRPPEPTPEGLKMLDRILKERDVQVGVASDPDGDRMVLGIEGSGVISEEATFPVVLDVLARNRLVRGPVVVNYSTSRWVDHVAKSYGMEVVRSPVGEANVLSRMKQVGGDVGGEGNGGVIWPSWNSCRDGLLAAVLGVVQYRERSWEGFAFPKRFRVKKKYPGRRLPEVFPDLPDPEEVIEEDGRWMRWGETWVHLRPSNTEPVLRLIAEGEEKTVLKVVRKIEALLDQ